MSISIYVYYTEHFDPVNVRITELREALLSVTAEQKYLKARDSRHRSSELLYFIPFLYFLSLFFFSNNQIQS